jgi:hypothetical protein
MGIVGTASAASRVMENLTRVWDLIPHPARSFAGRSTQIELRDNAWMYGRIGTVIGLAI